MPKRKILDEIERLNLAENHRLDLINTVHSDELYNWTASKAPWSVQMGGSGQAPTNMQKAKARHRQEIMTLIDLADGDDADSNRTDARPSSRDMKPVMVQQAAPPRKELGFKSLDPKTLPEVRTGAEMEYCYKIAIELVGKIQDFHASNSITEKQREVEVG